MAQGAQGLAHLALVKQHETTAKLANVSGATLAWQSEPVLLIFKQWPGTVSKLPALQMSAAGSEQSHQPAVHR